MSESEEKAQPELDMNAPIGIAAQPNTEILVPPQLFFAIKEIMERVSMLAPYFSEVEQKAIASGKLKYYSRNDLDQDGKLSKNLWEETTTEDPSYKMD